MELMNRQKISQPTWRRYTFIALIVSGLACIASLIFGALKGLIALELYQVENSDGINRWLLISVGVIILGLAVYAILEPDRVTRFLTRRQTRYGSNLFVMSIAFLGILIFASIIAYQNPKTIADLTEDQQNTLTDEFLTALKGLPQNVTATAFYSSDSDTESADKLLSNIKANSNGKFSYSFENPDTNPILAQQEGITGNGKILLKMGDRKEIAAYAEESEIFKAFIRLTNPNARAVYFLTGHGETGIDQGTNDFSSAKQTLENKNYTVTTLNLITTGKIPDDALCIIIGGPQKPLAANEVELLKTYVDKGGSLVVLQDPLPFTQFGDESDPLADYLATDWGITLDDDLIIDTVNPFGNILYATSGVIGQHPITQDINQNLIIIMDKARSITLSSQPEGVTQSPLIQTSPPVSNSNYTWGEKDYTASADQGVRYDEGVDLLGPLNMAVAGENSTTNGRVVVMGNSLFATGDYYSAYGNGNFFINTIDWASQQEDLIQFTPRQTTERSFVAPPQVQSAMVILGSICFLPGLWIALGVWSWLARRRQG
jgi:ABC-type uncharacterized transport system involved in gliding motility auxiliary subunit